MPFKVNHGPPMKEMDEEEAREFNLHDRDPKQLNSYLQAEWNELIAEPDGIRSANCIWKSSYKIFRCSKCCCYNLLSALCFIPISFILGVRLACLSFQHIWCFVPLLKDLKMNCLLLRSTCTICCDSMMGPMVETMGLIFSRFKLTFFTQRSRGNNNTEHDDSRDPIRRI